jgi:hypothetical protein
MIGSDRFDVHQGPDRQRSGHDRSARVSSSALIPPHFLQPIQDEHQPRPTQANIFQRHQNKGELVSSAI